MIAVQIGYYFPPNRLESLLIIFGRDLNSLPLPLMDFSSDASAPLHPRGGNGATIEEEDAFLGFVAYATSLLFPDEGTPEDHAGMSWSWVVSRILKTCVAYPSGVTSAILLSDLFQAWCEQRRYSTSKKNLEWMVPLKRRRRRTRLPNTVTIDSIYEKNFLSPTSCLEAVVLCCFLLPGTNIYMLSLGDLWSSCTIDLYLHRRYYHLVEDNGIFKKGREVLLTGCCLRSALEGSGHHRLLPTEYLIILLDEDQDEDAMLLGAQFCTDSFSSLLLDNDKGGAAFSFYARIESIGSLEVQGALGNLQRKQIELIDNDGVKLNFLLWGEQVILANLFSIGCMLALDTPFIATASFSGGISEEICLEYGSATQLYLVPFVQHEEQVHLNFTQMRYQGSKSSYVQSQSQSKASQVMLPLNPQGSIDFSSYPFRAYIGDLNDKMTGISLYGVVSDIKRERESEDIVFYMIIEDITGAIVAKLHFTGLWSIGRLGSGHAVYITGLNCLPNRGKRLEVSWFEKDSGSNIVNLSSLPALLNSSCLHRLSSLSDIHNQMNTTNICSVRLGLLKLHQLRPVLSHSLCGYPVSETCDGIVQCSFCQLNCDSKLIRCFHLELTVSDESSNIFAWSTGQTATELLQISPDEFYELPEDEQVMYLYTLENERFMIAIVNSDRNSTGCSNSASGIKKDYPIWEITVAHKCD